MNPARRHLVIFVKEPRMGRVKSRLALHLGRVAAWGFYRHLMGDTVRRLSRDPRWTVWLAVTPDDSRHRHPWPVGCQRIGQGSGDLGPRMERALRTRPPGPVVLIGSDIPGIEACDIAAAFRALRRDDMVFGPAPDGGYWLVGWNRRHPIKPFAAVRWSSEHALADTLANLSPLRAGLIAEKEDVDDMASFSRVKKR